MAVNSGKSGGHRLVLKIDAAKLGKILIGVETAGKTI